MRLIGINGFKGSGKDTTYSLIARDHTRPGPGGRVERRAFADKLKIMAALALGFERPEDELIALMDSMKHRSHFSVLYEEPVTPADFEDTSVLHDFTGREYLQWFGGHARTVFGDSFWIDQVIPSVGHFEDDAFVEIWGTVGRNTEGAEWSGWLPSIGVITDARYPNEAQCVRALGGDVLEIIRPGLESDGHSSEQPLARELVTHTIVNDGTIEDLAGKVSEWLAA